jgi:phosphoribosylformimino-5-aminoimidazole carboxamide ribotide isomerase
VEIIPVIDLMGGRVVHAKAGLRDDYAPIKSLLTQASDLRSVVADLHAFFPFKTMYIADLDAISGQPLALAQYQQLARHFPEIVFWLDVGIKEQKDLADLAKVVGIKPVLASETLQDISLLSDALKAVLSLDFGQGQFLGDNRLWQQAELWPHQVIIMNLDYVGVGQGPDMALLKKVRAKNSQVNIVAAGGVRGIDDLELLKEASVAKVLVASALHDGSLSQEMLANLT